MIYIRVVDTVVLQIYWNTMSCRVCFEIVVAVGKVHCD